MKKVYIQMSVALALAGLTACGNKIPKDIIQPDVMENLLYDYHLAVTLSADVPYKENYKKDAYFEYVFRKHHVTREEFDSSMVWYTRNTKQLADLYDKVQKRFELNENYLKMQMNRSNSQISVSLSGDTVDIWQDRTLCWLSSSVLANKLTFDLKTDTTFHAYDAVELKTNAIFLPAKRPVGKIVMGLKFSFENDSIQGITKIVSSSGGQSLRLEADSAFKFKSISGFVYYMDEGYTKGSVLLNDISLLRYHRPEIENSK